MREQGNVMVTAGLSDAEAMAFAQFLKRVGWREYRDNAAHDDEAHLMRDAGLKVQQALADAGYAPR